MKITNESRRKFLKSTVAGLAGATVLPAVLAGQTRAETEEETGKKKWKIVKRILGRTGLDLPVVSMGAMTTDTAELIRAALDAGITHIDTAHGYQRGNSEEMVGEAIKGRPRDSVVVATKVEGNGLDRKTGEFTKDADAGPFVENFETSLRRLGTDHVDILYLHSVVTKQATLYDAYLNAMVKLKKEGKARFIGVSTHGNEPEVIRAAVEGKVHDVVLTAYNFRQPHVHEMDKAMAEASKAGVGIVAMKTQAGVYWDRERQAQINMRAALKWALRNKNVHTSIPGISTYEHLETAMSVMADLELTAEEKKDLRLGEEMGMNGLFCDQCRVCVGQCPKGVDVPTLLRSYMYTYGYRDLAVAKQALEQVDLAGTDRACETCETCTVECTMGFDVRTRIRDVARIRHVPDDFVA